MSEPLVYIDHSDVLPGKLEELKAGVEEIVEFLHAGFVRFRTD